MSKLRPKCNCPLTSYQTKPKKYKEKQDQYTREISYDIDECKNHPLSRRNRRNEVHRIFMIPLSELPSHLNTDEEAIFKVAFKNCQTQRISKSEWDQAVCARLLLQSDQQAFLDKYLQTGVVELFEEYYSTKSGKREYFTLTNRGYNFLKEQLDIIERNEQITNSQQLIEESLQNIPQKLNPQLNHLIHLIKGELEKITSKNPYWQKDSGEKVKPESVQTKPAIYYIITKAICTWIKMYRERMTKRELSCACFIDDPLIKEKDPSKVLDKYYSSLEAIIQPQTLGFRDLDDFGLIKTLETVLLSGSIMIVKNEQTIPMQGSIILLNSFEFQNIKSITSECHKILCVENLSVFTQLVYDKFATEKNLLIIFIHGKSTRLIQKILKILANNNKKYEWWVWLDNDLGGVEIFQLIESVISPNLVNPIIPILPENVPYRKISNTNRSRILKLIENGTKSIQQFGNEILSKGKIEQEYFIKDYRTILNSHLKKIA